MTRRAAPSAARPPSAITPTTRRERRAARQLPAPGRRPGVPTLWLVTGAAIVVTAPLTLDVWSDYQCPFCEQFWTASEPRLVSTFVTTGQVRLVYHDFTFIGQESLDAAVAARCADRQGRFWPYHDVLFANQGKENSGAFSADRLATMAAMSGLDVEGWRSCLADESVSQAIAQETNQGRAAGVTGTPALFVNGAKVAGYDFPTVSAAIEAALRGAQTAGPSGPPDSSGAPPPATSAAP